MRERTTPALPPLRIGSLFSGIGGLELGLERAGVGHVVWQCEIDPFCRAVLAKHWPNVVRFIDVTQPRDYPDVDLICGGFPCQDVSSAGKRRGIGGERSSLWWHFARIVERTRPRFVVVENVASGKVRWLPHVRHTLHLLGYGTRALGIAAADVGAPHLRRRVFVVADTHGFASGRTSRSPRATASPDPDRDQLREQLRRSGGTTRSGAPLPRIAREEGDAPDATRDAGALGSAAREDQRGAWNGGRDGGSPVSAVRGVDDGFSGRLDAARKRALGNAVVPQCAEVVGLVIREVLRAA